MSFMTMVPAALVCLLNLFSTSHGARSISRKRVANGGWTVRYGPQNGAPVKSIARSGTALVGPRAAGRIVNGTWLSTVEIWKSADEGQSWAMIGHVAAAPDPSVVHGDPVVLAIPNSDIVLASFREHHRDLPDNQESFRIVLCRSDDSGQTWEFDSLVYGPFQGSPAVADHFVGAPFLRFEAGVLEVYFDNEPLPNSRGYHQHQWVTMLKRSALAMGSAWPSWPKVVSRASEGTLSRDGMPSVVDLGNNQLMVVTESVGPWPHQNTVGAVFSWDGGNTWDLSSRRTIYEGRLDVATGRHFNAYCPWAIRVGLGPVWVAFLTDEDFASPPDAANRNVAERRSSVKYIQTTSSFQAWSGASVVSSRSSVNYKPGLFERKFNDVICTVDTLNNGEQIVFEKGR